MATSSSVKTKSLLRYFSKTGEQPSSPKRRRDADDSEESESETDTLPNTEASSCSASAMDASSSSETSSSSGSKQSKGFKCEWLVGREHWLDPQPSGMYCRLCKTHNKRPFNRYIWNTMPCTRIRLQSITAHEQCAAHKDSVNVEALLSTRGSIASADNPPVPSHGMEQAFSCLYFLCKQRIPHTTNYEPLLHLAGLLGTDIKSKISIARNATYTSDKTIQEMVYVISEVIEVHIIEQMRKSEHFALMFDETADCTVTEQLAIHARFIDASSGEVKSHYLKILDVLQPESADQDVHVCIRMSAEVITSRIQDYAVQVKLDMRKMRGRGTDGAATMIGKHNGVVTRLKAITPTAISVHCAAHRLNLASSQAANAVPYVKKFNTILRQLYDFFDDSSVRTAGLKAIECLLQQKGSLVAQCTTRWLSIEQSVNKLRACFTSVVISLQREGEERGDAKALGLQAMVREYRFVATMLLMCDALPHVTRMSKCFQLTDCDYSPIPSILATTLASLEQLKTHDGLNLSKFDAFLTSCEESGIEIKKPANMSETYFTDSIRMPFLTRLVDNINGRFEDKSV